ncbi:MAG: ChbG/HpnK family deacetylase [Elusimicrobia bacterium]|nr:ChbG/HpnK family deacetylase [Elusimicrobiota bacterium]
MKKLIVNADDFGYSEEINKGVIYAHTKGIVTSASLFVNKEFTEDAVRQAKENPGLGLGIHLDLDAFFEIDNKKGVIVKLKKPQQEINEIKTEIKNQIEKYLSFSLQCDHLDSHHHSHLHPSVFSSVCEIASQYKIQKIRFFRKIYSSTEEFEKLKQVLQGYNLKFIPHFIEGWYWGNIDENYEVAELMTHPGYGELWRELEIARCCQFDLKSYLSNNDIYLIKFTDI